MKKIFVFLAFISSGNTIAQVKPDTATRPSSVSGVNPIPSAYSSSIKVNYIETWESSKPFAHDSDVISTSRTVSEVKQTTQYFDGLGRPFQSVVKGISPLGKDLVSPVVYDEFGREVFKYLPYVQIDSNTNTGKFKLDPFHNQASFFTNTTYNPELIGEQVFYSKTVFENSPLGRPDTSFAPGNSWGGSHFGILAKSLVNTAADSVRIWNISMTLDTVPISSSKYPVGQLYKSVTIDENGKQVIKYKDKDGQVILKKVQLSASPSAHHTGWLCTYYVYDDLNQLRFVIPPKAVDAISSNWTITTTIGNELCFRYEYDARKRMIIKKVPGAGEVSMVYDGRDRLIMSQDTKLLGDGKWMVTQYDSLNRPSRTYTWVNGSNRSYHEGQAASSSTYPTLSGTYMLLTETYYDNYSWVSGSGSGLSNSLITTYTSNPNYFYTASNTTSPYPQSIAAASETKGMVTGSKVNVLGTSTYLYSTTFYDDRGRVIQSQSTNYSGSKDTATMQYDFSGKLLRSLVCHAKGGTNSQRHIILTKNEYDDVGRLVVTKKKTNNSPEVTIAETSYDELGQLRMKKLGRKRDEDSLNIYTSVAIDSLKYSYNIRGWLRGINKDYARDESGADNWFGMELNYDFGFTTSQKNGNIAGIRWKSNGSDQTRAYGFTYDAVNRLMKSDFTQNSEGTWNTNAGIDFTMKMGDGIHPDSAYDANGNILKMVQKGLKIGASENIDSLTYSYSATSNKLTKVTDGMTANNQLGDFKDGPNGTADDYSYDDNGNLVIDQNKKITSIIYNHLNLPDSIRILGKGTIKYIYDATGNKQGKRTVDSTGSTVRVTTTLYMGGFVYQNDSLQFIAQEEGRIREKTMGGKDTMYYDYFLKDHLGNVRMVLTDEQKTDTYMANMEEANYEFENALFSNMQNIVDKPNCFDDNEENQKVHRVSAAEGDLDKGLAPTVVGMGKVLKVMAGDVVKPRVFGWWNKNETGNNPSSVDPIGNVIANLFAQGIAGINAKGNVSSVNGDVIMPGIDEFLETQSNYTSSDGAYLNYIFIEDETFTPIDAGFVSLMPLNEGNGCEEPKVLLQFNDGEGINISRNGYLYIYVSNTNDTYPVYFDDLVVEHIRGPLLEETHYYPFGLTMTGISSKAAVFGDPENKKNKFQNQEFNGDLSLDMYEFKWRMDDPQIGRFWQVDPLADKYVYNSSYAFSENKVTNHIELEGLEATESKLSKSQPARNVNEILGTNMLNLTQQGFNVPKMKALNSKNRLKDNGQVEGNLAKQSSGNNQTVVDPTPGQTSVTMTESRTVEESNAAGDKASITVYTGATSSSSNDFVKKDINVDADKNSNATSVTLSQSVGPISFGITSDNSFQVGLGLPLGGFNLGITGGGGFDNGLITASGGLQVTTPSKNVAGIQLKGRAGLVTAVAVAAAASSVVPIFAW